MPGTKRKADLKVDHDAVKRPRTGSFSQIPRQQPETLPPLRFGSSPRPHLARAEPCEDGEVREEPPCPARGPAPTRNPLVSSNVPVRRPKRGMPSSRHFDSLHDHYHAAGRKLKYSGDARFWSTFPPTHKEYRPLADPPAPNSPYHKFGGQIAKLELVDALVCFTYALWSRDYRQRICNTENWKTFEAFLTWCKGKWQEDTTSETEKAFLGLMYVYISIRLLFTQLSSYMIESFVQARKVVHYSRRFEPEMDSVVKQASSQIAEAISLSDKLAADPNSGLLGVKSEPTPQMLPSPASIAPANSASSTPTNRDGSTPSSTSERSSSIAPANVKPGPPVPGRLLPPQYTHSRLPIPPHVIAVANTVTVPIGPQLIGGFKDLTSFVRQGAIAATHSQQYLTLPIMARCFPKTFSRMIYSSLTMNDEHEPDIEDEECELLWPGQGVNGEGLGWVCLMGQAMIREFGKDYGYKGLEGVVPKPELPEDSSSGLPIHRIPQPPGSTPHGATPPIQR